MRPSQLVDQQFGLGLRMDDFWSPYTLSLSQPRDMRMPHSRFPYYRPWKTSAAERDAGSVVSLHKNAFEINLDVQHFGPEEISVKVTDDGFVVVEAQHDEREDEHGFISRHFVRKYLVPSGINMNQMSSVLSSDGVLKITAPKLDENSTAERVIPIQQTGGPSRCYQSRHNKKEGEGDSK